MGQIAVIGVMIPFCVVMLINSNVVTSQPYDAAENQNLYRLPLVMGETYADAIVGNLPPDGVVFADTVEPILNSLSGKSFPVLRNYDANTRIIPANGAIVVYTARAGEALPDAPRFSTPVKEFQVENGLQFGLFLFPAGDFELPAAVQTLDIPTQQGLRLMAYSLTSNNSQSRWTLTTYWQVEDTETQLSQSAYGMFIHAVNPNGEVVQSMDGKVIPGLDWRPGDVHIHRLRIDSQSNITTLRVGQFDAGRAENLVFLLPDGSQSIFVELPLISTEQGGE